MAEEFAISARGLGKSYTIATSRGVHPTTLAESLATAIRRPFAARRESAVARDTFWALRDVSFDIRRGEVVGIVGRNGAGKSTLLKVLSRITEPTTGSATLYGRVGSLLEVGTGFHPELTGRENIFLNGSLLGMTRREVERAFPEIVAFAEIDAFLDTPVKRYSSGMYVRLAFSVAAHLNPEILIVDEVLAVGDAAFQRKCLGKMRDVAQGDGRTVLFVSHNLAAVRSLCTRALLLEKGCLALDSTPDAILARYAASVDTAPNRVRWSPADSSAPDFHFTEARAASVGDDGTTEAEISPALSCSQPFEIVVEFEVKGSATLHGLQIGFTLQTETGETICGSHDPGWAEPNALAPGRYVSRVRFPADCLNEGRFAARFFADIPHERRLQITDYDLALTVEDREGYGVNAEKLPGIIRPRLEWETKPEAVFTRE